MRIMPVTYEGREKDESLQSPAAVKLSSEQSPLQKNIQEVLKERKSMTDLHFFASTGCATL